MESSREKYIQIRSILAANVDMLLENLSQRRLSNKIDSDDLFGSEIDHSSSSTVIINSQIQNKSKFQILLEERESLGLFISGNPLEDFIPLVESVRETILRDDVHVIVINKIKKIFTKKNLMMFALHVSTINGEYEGIIFPKRALEFSPILQEKSLFWVKAKLSIREKKDQTFDDENTTREYDEAPKMLIEEIVPFSQGVLDLMKNEKSFSLTSQRTDKLNAIDWAVLEQNPSLVNTETPTQTSNTIEEASPVILRFPKLTPKETLIDLKRQLSTEPRENFKEVCIEIESDAGWKRVKGKMYASESTIHAFTISH